MNKNNPTIEFSEESQGFHFNYDDSRFGGNYKLLGTAEWLIASRFIRYIHEKYRDTNIKIELVRKEYHSFIL
jgi:hypothetical protein